MYKKLFLLLVGALLVRLAIAFFFFGPWDTESVYVVSDLLKKGSLVYNETWRFNNPPVWLWMISFLTFLSEKTGIALSFWAKTPFILSDLGLGILIYFVTKKVSKNSKTPLILSSLYFFSPIALWVSAYQGQLDSLMLLLIFLAILGLENKNHLGILEVFLAGFFLGLSATIKLVPLGVMPIFVIYLFKKLRRQKEPALTMLGKLGIFGGLAIVPLVLVFLPYLSVWETGIKPHVLGYKTAWGIWGTSLAIRNILEYLNPGSWFLDFVTFLKNQSLTVGLVTLIAYIIIWWKNYSLSTAVFILFLTITAFSPFLAPQYLLWVVPFWILQRRNLHFFMLYNILSTISLFLLFAVWQKPEIFDFWSGILNIQAKNLQLIPFTITSLSAWILVLIMFFKTVFL